MGEKNNFHVLLRLGLFLATRLMCTCTCPEAIFKYLQTSALKPVALTDFQYLQIRGEAVRSLHVEVLESSFIPKCLSRACLNQTWGRTQMLAPLLIQ